MKFRHQIAAAAGAVVMIASIALASPLTRAQDATPAAEEAMPARPAHIHLGNCNNLGEISQPLTDLTGGSGRAAGQSRRATPAQSSFTSVPVTLDSLLGGDFAINVHLSADEIGTYIACGEIGGPLDANGALIIGLRELSNSGYTGIAYLAPGADGASTGVSVFVSPTNERGSRLRERAAASPVAGAATVEETPEEATLPATDMSGTPEAGGAMETPTGIEIAGTPAANGEQQAGAGQQVDVSEMEFMIDMPTTLSAGEVTFSVTNNGTITHSFEIEGNGVEEELETPLSPGQTGTLTVDLAPGTYEVYCPIANHADLGMKLDVTVS